MPKIFNRKKELKPLDQLVEDHIQHMLALTAGTDEYSSALDELKELIKLRDLEKSRNRPSPDAILGVTGNLLTTGVIMGYERGHAITSKAFSFIGRNKT